VDEHIISALNSDTVSKLCIVDISPQNEEIINLIERKIQDGVTVALYDHHKTAQEFVGDRDWAVFDMGRCGTKIFAEEEGLTKGYEDFIYHVNDYDLWIHESPKSKDLNYLMYILGRDKFVKRFVENPSTDFTEQEEMALALYKDKRQQVVDEVLRKAIFVRDNFGHKVCVCISGRYASQIGSTALDRYDVDYVVILDLEREKGSLRSRHINVGNLAKALGGGGHELSAGFEMPYTEMVQRFIKRPKRILVKERA
jgi:oligoribonuclease NrnB/cAMP/cGMP phosphodiesterase (DHH superfamily)